MFPSPGLNNECVLAEQTRSSLGLFVLLHRHCHCTTTRPLSAFIEGNSHSRRSLDLRRDPATHLLAQHRQIIARLHRQPELWLIAEEPAKTQRRLRRNPALARDDLLNPLRCHTQLEREGSRRKAAGRQLLMQHPAWMDFLKHHDQSSSMVVHDFDIMSVAVREPEYQPPGAVDGQ